MEQTIVHFDKNNKQWKVSTGKDYYITNEIALHEVTFFVTSEARELIRERKKTMTKQDAKFPHAFAIGEVIHFHQLPEEGNWYDFNYDVFNNDTFILTKDNSPLYYAKFVFIKGKTLRAMIS